MCIHMLVKKPISFCWTLVLAKEKRVGITVIFLKNVDFSFVFPSFFFSFFFYFMFLLPFNNVVAGM
jgi:hypothetical protein